MKTTIGDKEWEIVPLKVKDLKPNPDNPPEQFDIENQYVKITFAYKDSHEIIDKFLREIHEKYPELIYQVEINDQ